MTKQEQLEKLKAAIATLQAQANEIEREISPPEPEDDWEYSSRHWAEPEDDWYSSHC